jgi:hypothetical protein
MEALHKICAWQIEERECSREKEIEIKHLFGISLILPSYATKIPRYISPDKVIAQRDHH